jgi:hypothetical protein
MSDPGDRAEPTLASVVASLGETMEIQHASMRRLHDTVRLLVNSRARATDDLLAIRDLFSGGPDTACRTTWHDGVEYVEVPMDELREALG